MTRKNRNRHLTRDESKLQLMHNRALVTQDQAAVFLLGTQQGAEDTSAVYEVWCVLREIRAVVAVTLAINQPSALRKAVAPLADHLAAATSNLRTNLVSRAIDPAPLIDATSKLQDAITACVSLNSDSGAALSRFFGSGDPLQAALADIKKTGRPIGRIDDVNFLIGEYAEALIQQWGYPRRVPWTQIGQQHYESLKPKPHHTDTEAQAIIRYELHSYLDTQGKRRWRSSLLDFVRNAHVAFKKAKGP